MQIVYIISIKQEIVLVMIGFEFEIKTETNFSLLIDLHKREFFSDIFIYAQHYLSYRDNTDN